MSTPAAVADAVPVFTVTAGSPTPEEIAAVAAVLASLSTVEAPKPNRRLRPWASSLRMRSQVTPVPGGWRLSGMRI